MPIAALPEDDVRQIGSILAIASPVALLKELLDNAIDSGATSIDVLVSPNTVDRVEVRDNGHGIDPDDFDSLGRPGHTSKLRSWDELGTLGGRTLGFRGAALASANTLADITLTTRTPIEHVATVITLAKGGGIGSQRHVPAPVGTAVRAAGLFARLPVRRQVAEKEAPKNLTRMKELLHSYALARPQIRLRFTVLKTPNLSWSYTPTAKACVNEAVMQLFGTELASQCTFDTYQSNDHAAASSDVVNGPDPSGEQSTGLVFEGFLPRRGAEPRKIGKGAFISVDSRPITPARGAGKKLYAAFREHLRDHIAQIQSVDLPKDPFIRLNVRCPPGYYDVNIEALKDDVLFKEEDHVLHQFQAFLSLVYSGREGQGSVRPSSGATVAADVETSSSSSIEIVSHGVAPQVRLHGYPRPGSANILRLPLHRGESTCPLDLKV